MTTDLQTIRTPSGDELVVIPRAVYEDLVDAKLARDAKAALARGEEELLSEEETGELLASPTPLAFWRRKRKIQQGRLSDALGTSQGYVSDLESGRRKGSLKLYRRAATELRVPLEAILPAEDLPGG